MPAGKKKKKPQGNPARGFATTSVPSKPKSDLRPDAARDSLPTPDSRQSPKHGGSASTLPLRNGPQNRKSEETQPTLSPEEFEAQLERDDLQLFVENYGPGVARDSQRQLSKIQTDMRVLRNQSHSLTIAPWLSDVLLEELLEYIRRDNDQVAPVPPAKNINDEIWVSRYWTLLQTLIGLQVPKDRIFAVLKRLQLKEPPPNTKLPYIWGLSECMEALALDMDDTLLPQYDAKKPKAEISSDQVKPESLTSSLTPSPYQTPQSSAPVTRVATPQPTSVIQIEDFDVSDIDSDVEPDEMVDIYVSTKVRLFQIHPDLALDTKTKKKKDKAVSVLPQAPTSNGIRKLQERLRKLESDALFEADSSSE